MKIFLGFLVLSSICSSLAFAQGGQPASQMATVKSFEVSKSWSDLMGLTDGIIEIDNLKNAIRLTLIHADKSVSDVEVELPIVERSETKNHIKVIKAVRDRVAVDGPKETLVVDDLRSMDGGITGDGAPTRITYDETAGWTPKTFHAEFSATALK